MVSAVARHPVLLRMIRLRQENSGIREIPNIAGNDGPPNAPVHVLTKATQAGSGTTLIVNVAVLRKARSKEELSGTNHREAVVSHVNWWVVESSCGCAAMPGPLNKYPRSFDAVVLGNECRDSPAIADDGWPWLRLVLWSGEYRWVVKFRTFRIGRGHWT